MFWKHCQKEEKSDDDDKAEKEKRSGKNQLSVDFHMLWADHHSCIRYHRADDLISQQHTEQKNSNSWYESAETHTHVENSKQILEIKIFKKPEVAISKQCISSICVTRSRPSAVCSKRGLKVGFGRQGVAVQRGKMTHLKITSKLICTVSSCGLVCFADRLCDQLIFF